MFQPTRSSREGLTNYIGARVTDTEVEWLRDEMRRHKLTMSDLIRFALNGLKTSRKAAK